MIYIYIWKKWFNIRKSIELFLLRKIWKQIHIFKNHTLYYDVFISIILIIYGLIQVLIIYYPSGCLQVPYVGSGILEVVRLGVLRLYSDCCWLFDESCLCPLHDVPSRRHYMINFLICNQNINIWIYF